MILKSRDDKRPVVTSNASMGENTHGDLLEGVGDYIQGRNIQFHILSAIGIFTIGFWQDLSLA